jgi:transposase
MAKYKESAGYCETFFLSIDLRAQLESDPFARALNEMINGMDLSVFDTNYHNDEAGAAAIPPAILLKIVMYCYSKGILSSRKMEEACKKLIVVKALARELEPDHSTIAAFVSSNPEAVKRVALEVILKCGQLDLIKGDLRRSAAGAESNFL